MTYRTTLNRPLITRKGLGRIASALTNARIAAYGHWNRRCSRFLEQGFGVQRALMTPSCTAPLEMAAMLLDPGDEVILPSYTFVSTASAAACTGAHPVFVHSPPFGEKLGSSND